MVYLGHNVFICIEAKWCDDKFFSFYKLLLFMILTLFRYWNHYLVDLLAIFSSYSSSLKYLNFNIACINLSSLIVFRKIFPVIWKPLCLGRSTFGATSVLLQYILTSTESHHKCFSVVSVAILERVVYVRSQDFIFY